MKHNDKHILHVVNIYFVIPYFLGGQFEYFRELGYELNVVCSESPYLAPYAQQHHFGYREIPILRSINPIQDFVVISKRHKRVLWWDIPRKADSCRWWLPG